MAKQSVEQRLRQFLLVVVAATFLGIFIELLLIGHYEETAQYIPFLASGLGLLLAVAVWYSPSPSTLRPFRWTMIGIAFSSFVGMYFHFSGNLAFAREIHPSFSFWETIWAALQGSNPLLAPGILFLAGILGVAVTYRHPKLRNGT